ncbi:MAG TPA: amidohydrolase family protein, partial [Chloroflexaceae bacterium]|nr:amidohydrolase family protein [Chloroflexaceae bacterium]
MSTLLARDPAPDLILHGGAIHTLWPGLPRCAALAAKDGRVVALGDDDAVLPLAGPRTELVDLAGRTAIPGINDAHNHMLELGLKLGRVGLDECASVEELVALVREAADRTPEGEWIVGEGWNESRFAEGRLPTRHDLDAATTRHPVLLKRFFNMDVVNSLALERAGVARATPDPQGGRVERDAAGEPTGILRAAAKTLCRRLLPEPSEAERVAAIE